MGKMYSDLMFVLKKTLAKILIEESKKQSMEDKKLMTDNLMNKLKLLI